MAKQIETDFKTFVKFWLVPLLIGVAIFVIFKSLTGLIIIGLSIFLALALRPLVNMVNGFFSKHFGKNDNHQTLSAVFAYLIVVVVIGGIIAVVGPVVINETSRFISNFPDTFEKTFGGWDGINEIGRSIGVDDLHMQIENGLNNLSHNLLSVLGNNLFSSVSGIADGVMKIALILVLTLLFLLEGPSMADSLWKFIGTSDNKKAAKVTQRTITKMADVVSTYVSRQVLIAILDGCFTAIVVFILSFIFNFSTNLAIPMGMITMLFYLIPMFGQFIGGTLVTLILISSSPWAGLIYAIIYIAYSQIENNVIAPKIQGDALKLRPVIILCAIVIGMYMFGLLGAIIAVPIAGCIRVLFEEYPNMKATRE